MHSIAIVGAGPSGCYTAQALVKALPEARIDILDRLPVPYGLIRYGVACDHQGTKAVIRQFERVFERQGVGFFGNVTLGRDVSLEALRGMYDAVVLATGLHEDRALGLPGAALPEVIGAGVVTRAWNGFPDAVAPKLGKRVVVVGNGNVAVDLVRILGKGPDEFHGSDLPRAQGLALEAAGLERIDVVGRSPAVDAKFDPVMIRELGRLTRARVTVIGATGDGKIIDALAQIDGSAPEGASVDIVFHFGWTPRRIDGEDHVTGITFSAGEQSMTLPCDTVLTAIGFDGEIAAASAEGVLDTGLYATGWFRRGPRGTIPENRADALVLAARIATDLAETPGIKPGRDALSTLLPDAISYDGWKAIDLAETTDCPADRCRQKITTTADMLVLVQKNRGR